MYLEETGKIIVGYQGVGKSALAFHHIQVLDLESSNFFVDGVRQGDWYKAYCNIARSLCRQGYIVCVSSHKEVREELARKPAEKQVIVFPSLSLKEKWINMLSYRYERCDTSKNYKAWRNAVDCYESNITDLMKQQGFEHIEIPDMNYNLANLLEIDTR